MNVSASKDEYDTLKATHGDDIDFLWLSDVDDATAKNSDKRVLCKFTNAEAYIDAYVNVMQNFLNEEYYLILLSGLH